VAWEGPNDESFVANVFVAEKPIRKVSKWYAR